MKWSGRGGGGDGVGGKQFIFPRWWSHPANIIVDQITMAIFQCIQFIFPRPLLQGWRLGGVLNSARKGLRMTEARENLGGEGGKKTTPEG